MENKPMDRLMENFSKGNFDVTAEEIFAPITASEPDEEPEVDLAQISTDVQRAFKEKDPEDVLQALVESAKQAAEDVRFQKAKNPTQRGWATKIDQLHGIEKRLRRIIEDLTEI